jgi:3-methylcrotonyl-CoA carboxylase alpha subunit
MNTRLQVEHPVTELVCGLDLVQLQIQIAAGMRLPFNQTDIRATGHAIEARICAEDPFTSLPADGVLRLVHAPERPGIRHDCGVETGDRVTIAYDSLLAKLIAYGPDRATALLRLQQALREYAMLGVVQNIPLLQAIVAHPAFAEGRISTDFLQRHAIHAHIPAAFPLLYGLAGLLLATQPIGVDPWQAHGWRLGGATLLFQQETTVVSVQIWRYGGGYRLLVGGDLLDIVAWQREPQHATWQRDGVVEQCAYTIDGSTVLISWQGCAYQLDPVMPPSAEQQRSVVQAGASLQAPMPGTILRVLVAVGEHVEAQQPLIIMEAMKIEQVIHAPHQGVVTAVHAQAGMLVARGMVLVALA